MRRGWVCRAAPRVSPTRVHRRHALLSPHQTHGGSGWAMPRRARRPPRAFPARPRAPAVTRVPPLPLPPRPNRPLPLAAAAPRPPLAVTSALSGGAAPGGVAAAPPRGPGPGPSVRAGRGRGARERRSRPRVTPSSGRGAAHPSPAPRSSAPARVPPGAAVPAGGRGEWRWGPPLPRVHPRVCLELSCCLPAPWAGIATVPACFPTGAICAKTPASAQFVPITPR